MAGLQINNTVRWFHNSLGAFQFTGLNSQPREGREGKRNTFTYANLLGVCMTQSLATFLSSFKILPTKTTAN